MRRFAPLVFLFITVFAFAAFPAIGLADDPLSEELVQSCTEIDAYNGPSGDGSDFSGACQLCDLRKLAQRIINFAVAFTVVVATLMFTYAGILYFTAAAKPENIKKAHGIFVKVLAGMIIVLASWLIIDLLMDTLYDDGKFGPWSEINCERYPVSDALNDTDNLLAGNDGPVQTGSGGSGEGGPGVAYNAAEEQDVRTRLLGKININNCPNEANITDRECDKCDESGETSGCTNVGGLQPQMISFLENLSSSWRGQCTLTVTGGSEAGHEEHNNGYAFDLRTGCAPLEARIAQLPGGVDTTNNIRWIRESNPDHWHVCHMSQSWCGD